MPIVKSFSVGDGDTFYIKHGSDNFTIIDCNLEDDRKEEIVDELIEKSKGSEIITRFISTHPDTDHFQGLDYLDNRMSIVNFYCAKNAVSKDPVTDSYKRYKSLRDGDKSYYLSKGCERKWMNLSDDTRKSSGINILWPKTSNSYFKKALENSEGEGSPNNISIVCRYKYNGGAVFSWFGDLETDFMENIRDSIELEKSSVIFAPHHGRKSGRLPQSWLDELDPKIIIVGEAPSEHLEYYRNFNTIKQNSAGDITFDCDEGKIHIYCSKEGYSESFLKDENKPDEHGGYYIGTLET